MPGNARTRKELALVEQEKNVGFRQGCEAWNKGKPLSENPYRNDSLHPHQEVSWNRGWQSEKTVHDMNARFKKESK